MSLKICPWKYVPEHMCLKKESCYRMAKNHVWMNFSEWLHYVEEISEVSTSTQFIFLSDHPYQNVETLWLSDLNYAVSFYKQWPKDKQLDIHDVREALVLCGKPARPVSFIQANILLAQIFGWTCHHSMIIYDNLTFNHCDHKKDDFHDNNNDHHPRSKTLTLLPLWQDSPMSAFMGGLTGEGQHDHHIHQHCHS